MLERLLYSPFLVQLVVTRKCNLSCGYCNEYDKDSAPVPLDVLESRIDAIRRLGTWGIELTGGEPFEHPDLIEIITYASRHRFHKVLMNSNGYLFSAERIRQLNDAGLDEIQVSVDGVEPNETTVKVLKPLRKKLETLAENARFKVVLSGVIGSASSGEVLEVIAFAQSHGFRPRVLLIHDGDGQLSLTPEQFAEYHQVKRALGKRFLESGDYRTRLVQTGKAPFKCRAGSRYLYVDELGIVRWCSQTREQFGIPLEEYGFADLKRQFHTTKPCNIQCTVGCARTCSKVDWWRPQSRFI